MTSYSLRQKSWAHFAVLCICLLLDLCQISLTPLPTSEADLELAPGSKTEYILNPEKLDLLLHTAAMFTLIKAKSNKLLLSTTVPEADRVVYGECSNEAYTVVKLAKCVVALMNVRDRRRTTQDKYPRARPIAYSEPAEVDWITHLRHLIFDKPVEHIPVHMKIAGSPKREHRAGSCQHLGSKQAKSRKRIRKKPNTPNFRVRRSVQIMQRPREESSEQFNRPITNHKSLGAIGDRGKRGAKLGNIEKLRRVQRFYTMANECSAYMRDVSESNERFIDSVLQGPQQISLSMVNVPPNKLLGELEEHFEHFGTNLRILSPKFFSLFPSSNAIKPETEDSESNLLSPTMLSFHNDGMFSLPAIFKLVSSDEADAHSLLDAFMVMSGASKILDQLLEEMEQKMADLEQNLYPAVRKLRHLEGKFQRVKQSLSEEQRSNLDEEGYAHLNRDQLEILYGTRGSFVGGSSVRSLGGADDGALEEEIRRIAELGEDISARGRASARVRRQASSEVTHQQLIYANRMRDGPVVNGAILAPKAFTTTLLSPSFLATYTLSPIAFLPSILSPRAVVATVLSPAAFTANILSPASMLTEILSPRTFHTNVLSPRAITAFVLSPRTLLAEVLSPKLLEVKVLNPITLTVGVLNPNIGSPRVLSPLNFGVLVLSPNILSPTFSSKGNFTVAVLSPSIMSDNVELFKP